MKNVLLISLSILLSGSAFCMLSEEEQMARALSISEKEAKERTQELEDLRKALEISGQEAQERKQQQEQADYEIAQNLAREFAKEGQFIEKKVAPTAQEPEEMEIEANELIEQELDVWADLPEELKVHILTYLPYETLAKIMTSNVYNRLALDPMVMREFIKKFLKADPEKAKAAFYKAIEHGNSSVVTDFLKLEPKLATERFFVPELIFKFSPLIKAAKTGNDKMMKLLLEYVPEKDVVEDFNNLFSRRGNENLAKAYLQVNPRLANKPFFYPHMEVKQLSPLMEAVSYGDEKLVHLLLKYGADVNYRAENNSTALMVAARRGFADIAETLLNHGADSSVTDDENRMARDYASGYGQYTVLELLEKVQSAK